MVDDPEKLEGKAHYRWDRGQFAAAAELFEQASIAAGEPHGFSCLVRAGITWGLAGDWTRAQPILERACTFDWVEAGLAEDSHVTEWAFTALLERLAGESDREGFRSLFATAVARCAQLGSRFPRIHPQQESLLDCCMKLALDRERDHVVTCIRQRKLSRPLAAKLKALHL